MSPGARPTLDRTDPVGSLVELYASPIALRLYDEAVTELQHALQGAALAVEAGADDALVAAVLLHDVGHLVLEDNVAIDEELNADFGHDAAGARYLAAAFPAAVTAPIALHVAAKRYLCAVEPDYFAGLSPSSVRSLGLQGGPMTPAEVAEFESHPAHGAAVALRRWDDLAKVAGLVVEPFAAYAALLERVRRPVPNGVS